MLKAGDRHRLIRLILRVARVSTFIACAACAGTIAIGLLTEISPVVFMLYGAGAMVASLGTAVVIVLANSFSDEACAAIKLWRYYVAIVGLLLSVMLVGVAAWAGNIDFLSGL